jgi:pyruvate/2-oxoglutarate dehydrogenase complex dihydrolipoamide dehydrogenase (E3) component
VRSVFNSHRELACFDKSDSLVATGRTPDTDRLDVARAGIELDARGYLRVNDRLQTSAPDVWATGACPGYWAERGYDWYAGH